MKMKFKINETLLAGIIAFLALIFFVSWKSQTSNNFHCLSEYQTVEEYANGVVKWMKGELKRNPNMTKEELLMEREKQFYENNCEKSR